MSLEFTINAAELAHELGIVIGAIDRSTKIPVLTHVLMKSHKDRDRIELVTNDLDFGIRSSIKANIQSDGAIAVPAKRLYDYLRLLPGEETTFKATLEDWLSISCGKIKTRMPGIHGNSFPDLPTSTEFISVLSVEAMRSMIGQTSFAISQEESRFTLNGCLLVLAGKQLSMVATDGHRLALASRSHVVSIDGKYLLPKKALGLISKLGQEEAVGTELIFSQDENHFFFSIGQRLLIAKKLTGNFPDYERILPKEHLHTIALNRMNLQESIQRVAQFSDERARAIKLELEQGSLIVSSFCVESGASEELVDVDYSSPKLTIAFNAQYLLNFLKAANGDNHIQLLLNDEKSPGELRPACPTDGTEYRYVVMPMSV